MEIAKNTAIVGSGLSKQMLRYHYNLPEPTVINPDRLFPNDAFYPVAVVDDLCAQLATAQAECLRLKIDLITARNTGR